MKISPVEAELFHAHGQTDGHTERHDEANSRFSQFCERASKGAPQISIVPSCLCSWVDKPIDGLSTGRNM